ncbi:MAG: lysophospholipid acyltransferase family protein [Neisseria sp.]|nr:lysophospholipid acyltransferase family protein [Neisseria sp.]
MLFIRNLIYWLILVVSLLTLFPIMLLAMPLPNGVRTVAKWWVRVLMWSLDNVIGLRYRVSGAENIPAAPAIICAKHQSGWETLALQVIFPQVVFVAKKELFRIPFFGWGLKMAKTIGIERNSAQATKQLVAQGMARKEEGLWIAIFPEGTRVPAGERGRYKLGGARMAKLFEMDIVPVALNSGEFWPRNSFMKYPGTVDVIIGKPISWQSGSEAELMAQCENWIESHQAEINGTGYLPKK